LKEAHPPRSFSSHPRPSSPPPQDSGPPMPPPMDMPGSSIPYRRAGQVHGSPIGSGGALGGMDPVVARQALRSSSGPFVPVPVMMEGFDPAAVKLKKTAGPQQKLSVSEPGKVDFRAMLKKTGASPSSAQPSSSPQPAPSRFPASSSAPPPSSHSGSPAPSRFITSSRPGPSPSSHSGPLMLSRPGPPSRPAPPPASSSVSTEDMVKSQVKMVEDWASQQRMRSALAPFLSNAVHLIQGGIDVQNPTQFEHYAQLWARLKAAQATILKQSPRFDPRQYGIELAWDDLLYDRMKPHYVP